jgi:cytochrome c oxidase subunit 2
LFIWITNLTLVVFFAVTFFMIYFMVKYRARRGVKAIYNHGNDRLEVIWTTIPAMIFIGIVIYSNLMWKDIFDETKIPKDALNVEIVAEQYGFNIRYPGPDNILGKTDDKLFSTSNKLGLVPDDPRNKEGFTTYNEFCIPVGRAIHMYLRSRDVIHAFFVPEFRLGQDMVPGRTISYMWFQTTRTGNFNICCNQLCGAGHYNMQSKLKVLTQEDYDKWYQSKLAAATAAQNQTTSPPPVASTSNAGTASHGAALVRN